MCVSSTSEYFTAFSFYEYGHTKMFDMLNLLNAYSLRLTRKIKGK